MPIRRKPCSVLAVNMDNKEEQNTMSVLASIERTSEISQRELAQDTGIALGVVNACIKRCVRMGWLKVKSTPARRYAYFLTPTGFSEKARLTKQYMQFSLALYRAASRHFQSCFEAMGPQPESSLVFVGLSDLTEIACLWAERMKMPVAAIWAFDAKAPASFHGVPVVKDPALLATGCVMMVTSLVVGAQELERVQAREPQQLVLLNL